MGWLEVGGSCGDGERDPLDTESEEFVLAEAAEHFGKSSRADPENLFHGVSGGFGNGGGG